MRLSTVGGEWELSSFTLRLALAIVALVAVVAGLAQSLHDVVLTRRGLVGDVLVADARGEGAAVSPRGLERTQGPVRTAAVVLVVDPVTGARWPDVCGRSTPRTAQGACSWSARFPSAVVVPAGDGTTAVDIADALYPGTGAVSRAGSVVVSFPDRRSPLLIRILGWGALFGLPFLLLTALARRRLRRGSWGVVSRAAGPVAPATLVATPNHRVPSGGRPAAAGAQPPGAGDSAALPPAAQVPAAAPVRPVTPRPPRAPELSQPEPSRTVVREWQSTEDVGRRLHPGSVEESLQPGSAVVLPVPLGGGGGYVEARPSLMLWTTVQGEPAGREWPAGAYTVQSFSADDGLMLSPAVGTRPIRPTGEQLT